MTQRGTQHTHKVSAKCTRSREIQARVIDGQGDVLFADVRVPSADIFNLQVLPVLREGLVHVRAVLVRHRLGCVILRNGNCKRDTPSGRA